MHSRWYEKHIILSKRLDEFKEMDQINRDYLIKGVMNLITHYDSNLLSCEKTLDFPLTFNRLRWYDKDPYLWLMFNTLKIADSALLQLIANYLENEMQEKKI